MGGPLANIGIEGHVKKNWTIEKAVKKSIKGWEVWNLNDWLCEALGQRLILMAEGSMSFPGEYYPAEQWVADLRKAGDALLAFKHADDGDLDEPLEVRRERWERIHKDAQEALIWVAYNLGTLWD